ncbi:MAG: hypothetical protein ACYDHN_04350 [Solirubrobacteraceae bacterium]
MVAFSPLVAVDAVDVVAGVLLVVVVLLDELLLEEPHPLINTSAPQARAAGMSRLMKRDPFVCQFI